LKEELTGNFLAARKKRHYHQQEYIYSAGRRIKIRSLGFFACTIRMQLPKGESLQRRLIRYKAEVTGVEIGGSCIPLPDGINGFSEAVQYNDRHLPGFVPLHTDLIFLIRSNGIRNLGAIINDDITPAFCERSFCKNRESGSSLLIWAAE
jgi:hypothetical protein